MKTLLPVIVIIALSVKVNADSSEAASTDPFGDPDWDLLTNEQEAFFGTVYNNPNTDNDALLDGSDFCPTFQDIAEPRVPETNYAIIDLGPDRGAIKVNAKLQVVAANSYWVAGQWIDTGDIRFVDIANDGAATAIGAPESSSGAGVLYRYAQLGGARSHYEDDLAEDGKLRLGQFFISSANTAGTVTGYYMVHYYPSGFGIGGTWGIPTDINDGGECVGFRIWPDPGSVYWSSTSESVGVALPAAGTSINNKSFVAGGGKLLYRKEGQHRIAPFVLPNTPAAGNLLNPLNERLEVVGTDPDGDPAIWRNSMTYRIADLVPANETITQVFGINDNGVIAAAGTRNGSLRSLLLLPVHIITINTFIPQNNVDDPANAWPLGDDHVFERDNRISGTPARATWNKDGSRRTQQRFNVIPFRNMGDGDGLEDNAYNDSSPTGPKNSFVLNRVGTTRKYEKTSSLDSSGNLTPAAHADKHKADGTLMVDEDTASNSGMKVEPEWLEDRTIKIKCTVSVGNPLAPAVFENEIDYVFDIIIDCTNASATYSLSGKRNKFPAYEIYIGNKRIHEDDPLATGNGLTDLFGRGDPITPVVNAPLP